MPIANTCSIGYPHDGRADNAAYRHDRRADNAAYRHDRRADSLSPGYQSSTKENNMADKIKKKVYLQLKRTLPGNFRILYSYR